MWKFNSFLTLEAREEKKAKISTFSSGESWSVIGRGFAGRADALAGVSTVVIKMIN